MNAFTFWSKSPRFSRNSRSLSKVCPNELRADAPQPRTGRFPYDRSAPERVTRASRARRFRPRRRHDGGRRRHLAECLGGLVRPARGRRRDQRRLRCLLGQRAQDRQRRRHQVVRRSRSTCPWPMPLRSTPSPSPATPTAMGPWRAASTGTILRSPDTTTRRERRVRSRAPLPSSPRTRRPPTPPTDRACSAWSRGSANDGAVDTSTLLGTSMDKAHPRGVATNNGSSFYLSGNNASTDTGIFTVPLGGGAKTPIAGPSSLRLPSRPATRRTRATSIDQWRPLHDLREGERWPDWESWYGSCRPPSPRSPGWAPKPPLTLPVPTSLVMLDANSGVAGVDTAYVTVDTRRQRL